MPSANNAVPILYVTPGHLSQLLLWHLCYPKWCDQSLFRCREAEDNVRMKCRLDSAGGQVLHVG